MIETKERIQLPMMALRGLTVFPNMAISFPVGRQKSLDALEVADEGDKRIFLVAQRDPEDASPVRIRYRGYHQTDFETPWQHDPCHCRRCHPRQTGNSAA